MNDKLNIFYWNYKLIAAKHCKPISSHFCKLFMNTSYNDDWTVFTTVFYNLNRGFTVVVEGAPLHRQPVILFKAFISLTIGKCDLNDFSSRSLCCTGREDRTSKAFRRECVFLYFLRRQTVSPYSACTKDILACVES